MLLPLPRSPKLGKVPVQDLCLHGRDEGPEGVTHLLAPGKRGRLLSRRESSTSCVSPAPNRKRPCTACELIKVSSLLSRAENRGNRDIEAHFRGVAWEGALATGCQESASSSDQEREESAGNAGRLGVEPGALKEMVPV